VDSGATGNSPKTYISQLVENPETRGKRVWDGGTKGLHNLRGTSLSTKNSNCRAMVLVPQKKKFSAYGKKAMKKVVTNGRASRRQEDVT